MKIALKSPVKRRDPIARDLLTPKYKMRVVKNRKKDHKNIAKIVVLNEKHIRRLRWITYHIM
jgi:hypothetical protein